MQQAWHIFRKDVRHLWPYVAVWVALVAFLLVAYPMEVFPPEASYMQIQSFLQVVVPLAWVVLVALLVLQEPLSGTTQFWLARPYDWRNLLAAKAMFLLLCVHVPLFVLQLLCLARNGFAASPSVPSLLQSHVNMFLTFGGYAAAVAVLSRSLGQFALIAMATAMIFLFVFESLVLRTWTSLGWVPVVLQAAILGLAALVVIFTQYRLRATRLASAFGVAGLGLSLLATAVLPWSVAMALDATGTARPLRVTLAGKGAGWPERVHSTERVQMQVPVQIEGLGDRDLDSSTSRVAFDGGSAEWGRSSVWRAAGGGFVHRFELPRDVYERHRERALNVRVEAQVNLYRVVDRRTMILDGHEHPVGALGRCAARPFAWGSDASVQVFCLAPSFEKPRAIMQLDGQWRLFQGGHSGDLVGILPLSLSPWNWGVGNPHELQAAVHVQERDATFPIQWTYENFKLADYAANPPR